MANDGLSDERTALAWQRTALALVGGCTVMARLTWSRLGVVAVLLLGTAIVLSIGVFWEGRVRQLRADVRRGRGGRIAAYVAAATVPLGVTELAAVALG